MKIFLSVLSIFFVFFPQQSFASSPSTCSLISQQPQRIGDTIILYASELLGLESDWCEPEHPENTSLYAEDSNYVTFGEPLDVPASLGLDYYVSACAITSRFRRMSITSEPDSYVTKENILIGGDNIKVKHFTAYEGVPFTVKAHLRSTFDRKLSPSYYYWSFGDGARAFPKGRNDEGVTHRFQRIGTYNLQSLVLTKGSSVGVDIPTDWSWMELAKKIFSVFGKIATGNTEPDNYPGLVKLKDKDFDSCDSAVVDVRENHAPIAKFTYGGGAQGKSSSFNFDASSSSDPDGNEILSYSWSVNGVPSEKSGPKITLNFLAGEYMKYVNVTLTVSDGGKSSQVTQKLKIAPVCMSCGGSGKYEL